MKVIQPRVAAAVTAGLIGAGLSLLRVDSYDEVYWGVMAERVLGRGDLPYFDMIDNKGPLLYVVMIGATLLPGSLSIGLATVYGATVAVLSERMTRLAMSVGTPGTQAIWWSAAAITFVMAFTTAAVTTELLAAPLVVAALVANTTGRTYAAIGLAALIDPRAALFVVPATLRLRTKGQFASATAVKCAGIAVLAGLAVLVVPALRLSLIETSIASRVASHNDRVWALTVLAIAPLVAALIAARPREIEVWSVVHVLTGVSVGALTMAPVGHHWAYVPVGLTAVPWRSRLANSRPTGMTMALVLVAALPVLHAEVAVDQSITSRTRQQVSAVASILAPGDIVFVWSQFPHLRAPYAGQTVGLAATSNIHAWGIADHRLVTDGLVRDLHTASLIVIDESLDPEFLRRETHASASAIDARIDSPECQLLATKVVRVYRCATPPSLQPEEH